MKIFHIGILLILLSAIKSNNQEELTLNANGEEDPSSQVEFDGLVLKVNEIVIESILKKVRYSLIMFYEENSRECEDVLNEFKIAAETIVRLVPQVGMFKMVCSENSKLCREVQKGNVPFVIWFNNDNYGHFEEKNSQAFIKTAELLSSLSKIKSIEKKDDLNQFLSLKNYHRVLAIVPNNETINDKEKIKNFSNSERLESIFENLVNDSSLIRMGEFNLAKIKNYTLLENIPFKNVNNSSILIFMKENIFDISSISGISKQELEQYSQKYSFLKDFLFERIHLMEFDKNDTYYNQNENFIKEILLNSLPYIFPLTNDIYNIVFSGTIRVQFLYILSLKHSNEDNLKRLEKYNSLSKIFRQKGHKVWFGFVYYNEEIKAINGDDIESLYKDEEKDFPLLLSYYFNKIPEEATRDDVYMNVFKKELNLENLEEFFLKADSNTTREVREKFIISEEPESVSYENYTNTSNLPRVVGRNFKELVMDFSDNVLVLLEDTNLEKRNLYNRYVYMLNLIKKLVDPKVLRIYRFNVELNDVIHTKLPTKYPTLRLFMRHGKTNPIDYNHGCKLESFSKFINHLIPISSIMFDEEQIKSFEYTINTDPNMKYDEKIDSLNSFQEDGHNSIQSENSSNSELNLIPQKEDL